MRGLETQNVGWSCVQPLLEWSLRWDRGSPQLPDNDPRGFVTTSAFRGETADGKHGPGFVGSFPSPAPPERAAAPARKTFLGLGRRSGARRAIISLAWREIMIEFVFLSVLFFRSDLWGFC